MAAKKQSASSQTYAQRVAADNDKWRKEIYAEHLDEAVASQPNSDIDQFRADSYKQALKDAKAARA